MTSILADMGLLMSCLMYLGIGLIIGLIMGLRGGGIVGNIVCGMIGAVLLGGACILFFRDFYGERGALVAAISGAVFCVLIIRWLNTYI